MTKPVRVDRAGGLVYSTDSGRMCPHCRQPLARCACRQGPPAATGDGIVRVAREKKGRGGKTVTLVHGLGLESPALLAMARQLKAACGSGGTVCGGVVEIQGDHVQRVMVALQGHGFTVKRAGG